MNRAQHHIFSVYLDQTAQRLPFSLCPLLSLVFLPVRTIFSSIPNTQGASKEVAKGDDSLPDAVVAPPPLLCDFNMSRLFPTKCFKTYNKYISPN